MLINNHAHCIMETIDGLSSETIVRLFQIYKTIQTTDICGTKPRATKDHRLKAVTWNNIRKSVELPGLFQIIHVHAFLRFCPRIRFICERAAENETM